MNIFYLDRDTIACAQAHCDKHVVKMILEYTQLLFVAYYETKHSFAGCPKVYKLTHKSHPCALWSKECIDNWLYLLELNLALIAEYKYRYNNKTHACEAIVYWMLGNNPSLPFYGGCTEQPQCFGPHQDVCYTKDMPIIAYRKYYKIAKTSLLNYTNRQKPTWLENPESNN